jgi:hypothetical protein
MRQIVREKKNRAGAACGCIGEYVYRSSDGQAFASPGGSL